MLTKSVETISAGHGLLEGPLWDQKLGLIVADATVGGVWRIAHGAAPGSLGISHTVIENGLKPVTIAVIPPVEDAASSAPGIFVPCQMAISKHGF